jgi:hypothetical protein
MSIKTENLILTEDVIHVVYEYYIVKILQYVLIRYKGKTITIVCVSDILQYLPWALLFSVTYNRTIDLFVVEYDASKTNDNWFMIEIILTSYGITTYCNDFNNLVLIGKMFCRMYGLRSQYINIEASGYSCNYDLLFVKHFPEDGPNVGRKMLHML